MVKSENMGLERADKAGVREYLECVCGLFIYILTACYTFYVPDGHPTIYTTKYHFFREMCQVTAAVLIPLLLLYYAVLLGGAERGWKEKAGEIAKSMSPTDIFMIFFALSNVISYFFTDFPETALWGDRHWYVGLMPQLFFVGIYFLVSRFHTASTGVFSLFMVTAAIVFVWGILNRFSIQPVEMQNASTSFISCIGNIDFFCGFLSVFFSVGIGLYLVSDIKWLRILAGIFLAVSSGGGVMAGADSAYVAMGVVFFFFLLVSFQKTMYMRRFLETCMLFCASCQFLRTLGMIWPGSINMHTPMMDLMLGNLTLAAFGVLLLLYAALVWGSGKVQGGGQEWIHGFGWGKYAAIGIVVCGLSLYLALLIINTRNPGSIGVLSEYRSLFVFDGKWGSYRGATWREGLAIFASLKEKKIFGVGPDCYSAYAYSVPELKTMITMRTGENVVAGNAHNECITYLVNIGILGLGMFLGIFASAVFRLIKGASKEPLCYIFAAGLLSYFFHNQFSFTQLESTPYLFMMLGLGESLIQRSRMRENSRDNEICLNKVRREV